MKWFAAVLLFFSVSANATVGLMSFGGGNAGGAVPVVQAATFSPSTPASSGGTVGTATATNSPTGWSIVSGDPSGDFAISSAGVITFTTQGQTDYNASISLKSATLLLQASNGAGNGTGNNSVNAYADGSVNAGAAYVQHADFFTSYAKQTGQTYSTRPPWKVAGVEYAAGMVSNATITIASPAVVTETAHGHSAGDKIYFFTTGALPTGITASNTNGLTAYFVLAAGLTTNSYEISTTSGGAAVNTSGSQSGSQFALKDPASDALPATCTYSSTNPNVNCTGNNVTFNYWFFHDIYLQANNCTSAGSITLNNNYFEIGANTIAHTFNFEPIQLGGGGNCSFTSNSNVYDGNAVNMGSTAQNMPGFLYLNLTGALILKYDAWINTLFRGPAFPAVATSALIEYTYAEGVNYNNGGGHGEFTIWNDNAGTWTSINVLFTTALMPNNFGAGYTAFWYMSGGSAAPSQTITTLNFSYNVAAINLYEFAGGISNGSGSAGTILNVTSTAGDQFIGTCSPAGATLSMGTIGGVTANTSIGACGTGIGGAGTYTVNKSQLIAPGTTMAFNVGSRIFDGFDATVTTSNIVSNYLDPTGVSTCFNVANATPTFTGNVNLRDGSLVDLTHCNGHF